MAVHRYVKEPGSGQGSLRERPGPDPLPPTRPRPPEPEGWDPAVEWNDAAATKTPTGQEGEPAAAEWHEGTAKTPTGPVPEAPAAAEWQTSAKSNAAAEWQDDAAKSAGGAAEWRDDAARSVGGAAEWRDDAAKSAAGAAEWRDDAARSVGSAAAEWRDDAAKSAGSAAAEWQSPARSNAVAEWQSAAKTPHGQADPTEPAEPAAEWPGPAPVTDPGVRWPVSSKTIGGSQTPRRALTVGPDGEGWTDAVAEWTDQKRGAPATIASEAWAPPAEVFERACDVMFIAWQPIVDWGARALYGFGSTLRTVEPELSKPRLLVEAAGRIGKLHELERKARRLIAEAAGSARDGALIFVELHPSELLDDRLCAGEDELGPYAHRCVLEISERVALDDIPEARSRIQQLRLIGYHIAVGSIGSGYAGLASVAELEPDIVKLDQALIRNIHNEPVRRRLVGGLLGACKDLHMAAVAEGVEHAAERDTLADLGCELMQGLLFGPPARGFPDPLW